MNRDEMYYKLMLWLRQFKGIGRASVRKVIMRVNEPEKLILGGLEDLNELALILERPARMLLNNRDLYVLDNQWQNATKGSDYVLGIWNKTYPSALKEITDPPLVLHCKGEYSWLHEDFSGTAIVGTRSPSEYGREYGFEIAKLLSQKEETIVSGMAMGIDASAHMGALKGCGKTIAVLGTGVDVCYPKFNQKLYNEIANKGLVISEYPSGSSAHSIHFPERNRIIAGLSKACIVIEAAKKSGSLITAEMAMDLGRDVYALPGPIHSSKSAGCHWLIRDGAHPIVDLKTLLDDLNLSRTETRVQRVATSNFECQIYELLKSEGALTIDMIHAKSGLPIGEIIEQLERLKSENYVKSCGFLYHI